uniref:Uncharacterized protein n=1 Tax=Tanacetum cinerariifolium TaxID=118510 RepID=A0A6L2KZ86_TANCI|nr:hypothetical protein [Tanacetum cinerariifolium]
MHPICFRFKYNHGEILYKYLERKYVDGHVDIFDMVDINLFTVIALNRMVLQLRYTEHGFTVVNSYQRPPPQVRATIEDISQPGYGVDNSGLSHDESFGVDDLDLNVRVNEVVDGSDEEDVLHGSGEEDAKQGNDHEVVEGTSGKQVNYDVNGVDSAYETQYMLSLVKMQDVLREEDIDVVNLDGFDNDTSNENETSTNRRRRLNELRREMGGIMNGSGRWKYSFYTGYKFSSSEEGKDIVYLHSIE